MQATDFIQHIYSWPLVEEISIRQHDGRPHFLDLFSCEALQRSLRSHRHIHRRMHNSVMQVELPYSCELLACFDNKLSIVSAHYQDIIIIFEIY